MHNQEKDIYLWNCGIISSATSISKLVGTDDGKVDNEGFDRTNRPEATKALPELRVFSTNYICQFTPDQEYISSLTLQPLKNAKEELAAQLLVNSEQQETIDELSETKFNMGEELRQYENKIKQLEAELQTQRISLDQSRRQHIAEVERNQQLRIESQEL